MKHKYKGTTQTNVGYMIPSVIACSCGWTGPGVQIVSSQGFPAWVKVSNRNTWLFHVVEELQDENDKSI